MPWSQHDRPLRLKVPVCRYVREFGDRVPWWWLTLCCRYCFCPELFPERAAWRAHRLYQEQGGRNGAGGWAVPLNLFSLFYFLLLSHPPPSTSASGGAVRAQELQ